MKTLYKKGNDGKIRIWNVYTKGSDLIQESGLLDGKLIQHVKTCTPKNINKKNQVLGPEQALKQLESDYKSKLNEGYFETKEDAETVRWISPMLALSYTKEKHKIDWTKHTVVNKKFDGMRCLITIEDGEVGLRSRDGIDIMASHGNSMQHITDEFFNKGFKDCIFDGELYWHEIPLKEDATIFQSVMKLIKKYRRGESENIKFYCYDMINLFGYDQRSEQIKKNLKDFKTVEIVEAYPISSEEDLIKYHAQFIEEGYEGTIVRVNNTPYKINGRSSDLLKYKDFDDVALTIKDIVPAEQRSDWGVPVFDWKGAKDDIVRAGTKMSHADRKDLLANKHLYIGKTAEIRFFGYTDRGVPRQPIMIGIRLDK